MWLCRLRNREQYQDFLKALNLYASEIVSKSELQQMVHDILSRYPDLMVSPFTRVTTESSHPLAVKLLMAMWSPLHVLKFARLVLGGDAPHTW